MMLSEGRRYTYKLAVIHVEFSTAISETLPYLHCGKGIC